MPNRRQSNNKNNNKPTLPLTPAAALQQLIRISQSLLVIAEKETQALLTNDMLAFSIMQYEKEKLTTQYTAASEAFRQRLEEFRSADRNLLDRLEKLQKDLAGKAMDNNALVDQVRERSRLNTQRGVMSALALSGKVRFDTKTQTEGV